MIQQPTFFWWYMLAQGGQLRDLRALVGGPEEGLIVRFSRQCLLEHETLPRCPELGVAQERFSRVDAEQLM